MFDIDCSGFRYCYWEMVLMVKMLKFEWEVLCDGCGKCCLNKLEDEDIGEVVLICVVCKLFDDDMCLCFQYLIWYYFVLECIILMFKMIFDNLYWFLQICVYWLVYEGSLLYDWYLLIFGDF